MTPSLDYDVAEGVLRQIKTVTGERGEGCPWWVLGDPFVQAVMRAHRHWAKGSLGDRAHQPEALISGLEIFDAALNAAQRFDIENMQEQRERETTSPNPRKSPRKRPPRSR